MIPNSRAAERSTKAARERLSTYDAIDFAAFKNCTMTGFQYLRQENRKCHEWLMN